MDLRKENKGPLIHRCQLLVPVVAVGKASPSSPLSLSLSAFPQSVFSSSMDGCIASSAVLRNKTTNRGRQGEAKTKQAFSTP